MGITSPRAVSVLASSGWLLFAASAGGQTALSDPAAIAAANRRCMECHGQQRIAVRSPAERRLMVLPDAGIDLGNQPAVRPELYLSDQYSRSVHSAIACVDCHAAATTLPHAQRLASAGCNPSCHTPEQAEFRRSEHAAALASELSSQSVGVSKGGGSGAHPTCASCHGAHDILPASDRRSRTYPLNIIKVCGDCHEKFLARADQDRPGTKRVQGYLESVHGQAVTKAGLTVSATCVSCHGAHTIVSAEKSDSSIHRDNVPHTCAQCHIGVAETYAASVHGQKLAAGNPQAPVCTDCHTAHAITRANTPGFMLDIVGECGSCHDQPAATQPGDRRPAVSSFYKTYRQSYHGQVANLGFTRAARCSSCHGAHDILPIADPRSRLHAENRVAVCQQCHPAANAKFASFQAHADYRDGRRYPLLHGVWLYFVVMMSFAFGFYGLHSLLWLVRSLIERRRHGAHPKFVANPHAIQRFTRFDRFNHALVILSFFGLTLTGMPLLFSDHAWGRALARALGGVRSAGLLHRFFALILIFNLVSHLVGVLRRMRASPRPIRGFLLGPTTMLPRLKDAQDCLGMFRWFFRGGKKPAFDRWTYWEKFDYTAEVGGSVIIGGSGLLLWFPQLFAQFLPGWWFNVAMIVHGYEALLAVGFIFTIHFFNAHLRLEKFPVDDVIFTGRLPEAELAHERGTEYDRLVATGEIQKLRVAPPPRWQRYAAVTIGCVAMAIGTTMVALIILAGFGVI